MLFTLLRRVLGGLALLSALLTLFLRLLLLLLLRFLLFAQFFQLFLDHPLLLFLLALESFLQVLSAFLGLLREVFASCFLVEFRDSEQIGEVIRARRQPRCDFEVAQRLLLFALLDEHLGA